MFTCMPTHICTNSKNKVEVLLGLGLTSTEDSCTYSYIFTNTHACSQMSPATRAIDLAAYKFILKNETGYKIYVESNDHCFIVAETTKMIE